LEFNIHFQHKYGYIRDERPEYEDKIEKYNVDHKDKYLPTASLEEESFSKDHALFLDNTQIRGNEENCCRCCNFITWLIYNFTYFLNNDPHVI